MKGILVIITTIYLAISSCGPSLSKISSSGPSPRYVNNLVYDNGNICLIGGKNNENSFNDFWIWDKNQWNLSGSFPIKIWDHSYVKLGDSDIIFLFGGRTFQDEKSNLRIDLDSTWIYEDNMWSNLKIDGPENRSSHQLVFFNKLEKVVLFGGRNKDKVFGDTWIFYQNNWKLLNSTNPPKRFGHSLAYDSKSNLVYMFGGHDGVNLLNDFWSFDGDTWKKLSVPNGPSPRMAHTMQFDDRGNLVVFGGWDGSAKASDELWYYSKGKWQEIHMRKSLEGRLSGAMVFDPFKRRFFLFGGSTGFDGAFHDKTIVFKL
ncbi:hypothetical protein GTQ34_15900 [Muricauda sp. JGD-17]|uniref:Galactose oxidase n=1 Tax=Flagellimonas ochracea TaxID=2696472 RepID=A0A964TEE8_9FLAO|nr:kelch repeat-containing protein [Allomuricauda ochracea]NAY93394.1 hypothetical protein [Allomuricauda ochracea]